MEFPHIITLFNRVESDEGEVSYFPTVIKGCLNRIVFASPKNSQGIQNGNTTRLYIPLNADTQGKAYLTPDEYKRLPAEEKKKRYTFDAESDFYVKGEHVFAADAVIKTADIKELAEVYKITAAELLNFGNKSLHHWEVSGE